MDQTFVQMKIVDAGPVADETELDQQVGRMTGCEPKGAEIRVCLKMCGHSKEF